MAIRPASAVRLVMFAPVGTLLIATGLAIGELLAAPAVRAALGPPEAWPCVDSPSEIAYQIGETTFGTAAVAWLAGAGARWRRQDGWLVVNVPSMLLGYWLVAATAHAATRDAPFVYWSTQPFVVQFVLVWTLYPWLFERAAAWRRGIASTHLPA